MFITLWAYIFIILYAAVYFNKKVLFPASVAKTGQYADMSA